jgi:hypothetical protein
MQLESVLEYGVENIWAQRVNEEFGNWIILH